MCFRLLLAFPDPTTVTEHGDGRAADQQSRAGRSDGGGAAERDWAGRDRRPTLTQRGPFCVWTNEEQEEEMNKRKRHILQDPGVSFLHYHYKNQMDPPPSVDFKTNPTTVRPFEILRGYSKVDGDSLGINGNIVRRAKKVGKREHPLRGEDPRGPRVAGDRDEHDEGGGGCHAQRVVRREPRREDEALEHLLGPCTWTLRMR
eukprot:gene1961-biopygen10802